jgi:hypothetical protein
MVNGSLRLLKLLVYAFLIVLSSAVIAGVIWSSRDTGPSASKNKTMSKTLANGTIVVLEGERGLCLTNQFRGYYRMKDGNKVTFCWILTPQKKVILIDEEGDANEFYGDEFIPDRSV